MMENMTRITRRQQTSTNAAQLALGTTQHCTQL